MNVEDKERLPGGEDALQGGDRRSGGSPGDDDQTVAGTPQDSREKTGTAGGPDGAVPDATAGADTANAAGVVAETEQPVTDAAELERKLAEQAARAEDYYQRLVRLQADFENYRKRTQREREEFFKFAGEQVVTALLPVLDNLERALAAKDQDPAGVVAGVEMIHRQLQDVLAKEGLSPLKAVGEQFDPALHEAVMQEESTTACDNTVLEEFCRGYCFKDRLIRPAMVKVARSAKKTGE
ncbi:nucleotide exchange factor GrpE [Desulfotomaculum copahuensis]|uniref:Protein GrpE n=1 Tax=Desulfotomaculum copahuensis TaxID=1838280 RepID=A0A1B7LFD6_9FIRM|nr:nucleotide exchange factor GrpE [Desulfotomaculum copahuensis]OAT82302.1 hypothetical protein A6M21_09110 [Desulfotomaculum copahuensis]